ncbi:hypothetical protein IL54_1983 [Sphingobium sp. ba1]|nr:hypothetical protein IL54_1983 [Sphingobium sp. ba1]
MTQSHSFDLHKDFVGARLVQIHF